MIGVESIKVLPSYRDNVPVCGSYVRPSAPPPKVNSTQQELSSAAIPSEAASLFTAVNPLPGLAVSSVNVPVGNILTAFSASDSANHSVSPKVPPLL